MPRPWGIKDLLLLGKLKQLEQTGDYDLIVLNLLLRLSITPYHVVEGRMSIQHRRL